MKEQLEKLKDINNQIEYYLKEIEMYLSIKTTANIITLPVKLRLLEEEE